VSRAPKKNKTKTYIYIYIYIKNICYFSTIKKGGLSPFVLGVFTYVKSRLCLLGGGCGGGGAYMHMLFIFF
jgi:hypothetical protein